MHAKVPLMATNKHLTKKQKIGHDPAQPANWQELMSKFVEAAALRSSSSTDIVPFTGIPAVPGLAVPVAPQTSLPGAPQLVPSLAIADVVPPLGLPAIAAAMPEMPASASAGSGFWPAAPGLQAVEPPLIGSPTVVAPKDMLQQLEEIGAWEEDKDDDAKSCSKKPKKLTKKPSALMKKPSGRLADGEVPMMAAKSKPAASGKMLQLGCPKCRGSKTGCLQCRNPAYEGKRGPATYRPRL